ncbi:ferredoxin [Kineococcus arenarius]|uniref:ferredoxin n=1 Tax=Kineococcus sp. SYSU DK007 TaxID=3383128 RepID=UPI003D7CEE34
MNGTGTRRAPAARLRIDWAACDGHGACTELLPELLTTDDWGFPVVRGGGRRAEVPAELLRAARRAERSCPVLALRLVREG